MDFSESQQRPGLTKGNRRQLKLGGGVGGLSKREGIYVHIQLVYFIVQQKVIL